jgi:hypothetical protein
MTPSPQPELRTQKCRRPGGADGLVEFLSQGPGGSFGPAARASLFVIVAAFCMKIASSPKIVRGTLRFIE